MKKTVEQIIELKDILVKQLESLPDVSTFGDDNSEDKEEMRADIEALCHAANAIPYTNDAVEEWVGGKHNELDDYLM